MDGSRERTIDRLTGTAWTKTTDHVVAEAPVEFRLGGVPIAVLMRTPGEDADLGLGSPSPKGSLSGLTRWPRDDRRRRHPVRCRRLGGLTVAGFLRGAGANVYSGSHRIVGGPPAVASIQ